MPFEPCLLLLWSRGFFESCDLEEILFLKDVRLFRPPVFLFVILLILFRFILAIFIVLVFFLEL